MLAGLLQLIQTLDSRLFLSFLGVAAHFHAVARRTFWLTIA